MDSLYSKIAEERVQEAEIKKKLKKKWLCRNKKLIDHGTKNSYWRLGILPRICNSAAENFTGVELPMGNELENKTTFQVGNLVGILYQGRIYF